MDFHFFTKHETWITSAPRTKLTYFKTELITYKYNLSVTTITTNIEDTYHLHRHSHRSTYWDISHSQTKFGTDKLVNINNIEYSHITLLNCIVLLLKIRNSKSS